ncbi:Oidioi.mRNA.OKI2018_I69.XSR.g13570.t1.cds [Oikopleura dioica]|uniref:Oidioi.mRNA.OKI2018_I69.XSR.g13570.t1.cds n=1 Tax=Oikopleura dioica TaxID=34765 RepID=A0ABN7SFR1_OIKDI|nr:Oidioi.mRNA.OKI2018_I69.XSR.g13570.t1.cds [Oikopleura dioica]
MLQVVCLNSLHSKLKLAEEYPGLEEALPYYYGGKHEESHGSMLNWTYLNSIDMGRVQKRIRSTFLMVACKFQGQDCSRSWLLARSKQGSCLRFQPQRFDNLPYSRRLTLSMVLAFNKTDWTDCGWNHHLDGFTIYITGRHDRALMGPEYIMLTDVTRGIPVVDLKQQRKVLLGEPYSECIKSSQSLVHYENYTQNQCTHECLINAAKNYCNCTATYFPPAIKEEDGRLPVCTFKQHAQCIVPFQEKYDYSDCVCPPECDVRITKVEAIQYGHYAHDPNALPDLKLTSVMFNLDNEAVNIHEHPEYTKAALMSDIGGAAGLILGMSASTIVGVLDYVLKGF